MRLLVPPVLCALLAPVPAHATPPSLPLRISIEDALEISIGVSHPLDAARANIDAAAADVIAARSTYYPQIAGSASYVRTLASEFSGLFSMMNGTDGTGGTGDTDGGTTDGGTGGPSDTNLSSLPFGREHIWNAGVDISQQIWDGGRTRANVKLAKTSRDLAILDFRSQRAQTLLETAQAYYSAVLAAEAVTIGEAALALAERTLQVARAGYEQGTTAEFDVVRAEVTRDNERTALVRARAERDIALVQLKQRLGIPLDVPVVLTTQLHLGEAVEVAATLADVSNQPGRAVVAQARTAVAAAQARIEQAEAQRWPQLTAFSSLGVVNYPRDFLPEADWRTNWTMGVSLSLPLFTGFRIEAQVRAARASRRSAEAQLAQTTELAAVDERTTRTDVAVAAATVRAQRRSAELAQRAADIAEVRYQQGVSTLLELTDAQLALVRAQLNLATAARDLQVARVRLRLLPELPISGQLIAIATPVTLGQVAIGAQEAGTPTTATSTATPTTTTTTTTTLGTPTTTAGGLTTGGTTAPIRGGTR